MINSKTVRRVREQNKELKRQKQRSRKFYGPGGDKVDPNNGGFGATDESEDEKEELIETVEQLTKACESYRNELKKAEDQNLTQVRKLQKENDTLQLELCRCQERSEAWKLKCHKQENESVVIAKNKLLENENANMQKDLDVLKIVIRRLNKEISFYQTKLRERYQNDPTKLPIFSSDSENENSGHEAIPQPKKANPSKVKRADDLKEPRKTIQPLLIAYDEIIEEKNEIIREHELTMQKFKLRCQEIVQENEELHRIIGESKNKDSVSLEEWQILYKNATLVLEENDLLQEQIEIAKRKLETLENSHLDKITKLKSKINHLEDEKMRLKNGLTEMDKQCYQLTQQINSMSVVIQQRIPKEQHEASIEECKRLYNELKSMYSDDRNEMLNKLKAVDEEKQRLVVKVNDIDAENMKLQDTIKILEKDSLETSGNFIALRNELSQALKSKSEAEKTISEMMKLTDSVVIQKESVEHSYQEQQQALSQMMHMRNQESLLIKECEENVKKLQKEYDEKLRKSSGKLEKLEELLETIAQRHVADIAHLKELIVEKNIHIDKLQTEKKQLMDDLETVWKATTKECRSTFSKSSKYRREHASSPNLKTCG